MNADQFRNELAELGISQRWLARRLGVAQSTVNHWALGHTPVPPYVPFVFELLRRTRTMELSDFRIGDRVELHPATDLWMRGARYGTVRRIGKALTVELDATRKETSIRPTDIARIVE